MTGLLGPGALGLPAEGDVAAVSRALLEGEPVVLDAEVPWPLPVLASLAALAPRPGVSGGTEAVCAVRVTDRAVAPGEREVVLRPPSLAVGVGACAGAAAEEVLGVVEGALREAGLSVRSVALLATVDTKAAEPGVVAAAARLGVPLVTYSAGELAAVTVPNPSDASRAAVGTPSVAEAAALVGGGELLVPKTRSAPADGGPARATCAVVRRPAPSPSSLQQELPPGTPPGTPP
ncbi:cobalamin biosynthesis protein [Streptomyces sp. NRRL S-340]|uniref:cobalamin biosynthesis protein n=1 Tax=Streptomyces sp. NRRL S-340 TaxID=1463901 RepID=UPI000A827D6E